MGSKSLAENTEMFSTNCNDYSRSSSGNKSSSSRGFGDDFDEVKKGRRRRSLGKSPQRNYKNKRNASPFRRNNYLMNHQNNVNERNIGTGFKKLEALSQKSSAEDLMLEILNNNLTYWNMINSSNITNDSVVLLIKILRKICESPFKDSKYKILQTTLKEDFLNKLKMYIACLPMQEEKQRLKNTYFWDNVNEFWNNLIYIFEHVIDNTPTFACNTLHSLLKALKCYIPVFEQTCDKQIPDELKEKVQKLTDVLEAIKQKQIEAKSEDVNIGDTFGDEQPPDDFHDIPVYPTPLEIVGGRGFLRPNITKGPYKDVNHYLDTQFRLLREDFVAPLRDGINFYRFAPDARAEGIEIHKNVKFLNPETVNEHYCFRVQIDRSSGFSNLNYENRRRLMFGSLLCFTNNNFQTLIFAKIADRNTEDLQKGQIIVSFDEKVDITFNTEYLMLESNVYFEPYFHVLNVLKKITVNDFPMEDYIIKVNQDTRPPEYLLADCTMSIQGQEISPLAEWPKTNFYNFNKSQLLAFKAAITQAFTIIQGPPGTGKTFLGLKIAQTLLENKQLWYKGTPLLVVCYTNHALDQFLEGLLEYTTKIIRVGGQSQSDKLKEFNLKNNKKFKMSGSVHKMRRFLRETVTEIATITENLKHVNNFNSVCNFRVFEDIVPKFENSWFYNAKNSQILSWLLQEVEMCDLETMPQNLKTGDEKGNENLMTAGDPEFDDSIYFNDSNILDVDELFEEVFETINVQSSTPLISLKSITFKIEVAEQKLADMNKISNENATEDQLSEKANILIHLLRLRKELEYLERKLAEGKRKQFSFERPLNTDLVEPYEMPFDERWNLYFHCLKLYRDKLIDKLFKLKEKLRETYKVYGEMRKMENARFMKNVLVIGMTTTSAARLRSSLEMMRNPVIIVEEAAEVLEAHIVASVTKYCKHLILIGDHQQLQPSTADYSMNKDYKLGISLFERMILNNIHCYSLDVQHRMRPEISALITPAIYPSLKDHPSVKERPPVAGVDSNLYFIDHASPEEDCKGTSKRNFHEVSFFLSLANYLILNGYKPENIIILAAYLGQLFLFQREKKFFPALENVRCSVVDNYQGEECDIVLLSLVRSNKVKKIGFLSVENRVCVALSRAKCGLYIMGNMSLLCSTSSIWVKINETLKKQDAVGPELPLRCQVHPEVLTFVKSASDFLAISEGGCDKKCGVVLRCGHNCPSKCHPTNLDHTNFVCRQECGRSCSVDENHRCMNMCFQKCPPCTYSVSQLLDCGHTVVFECQRFNEFNVHNYNCNIPVSVQLPCGHQIDKACHLKFSKVKCELPCKKSLDCGHSCKLKCHFTEDPYHLKYKCRKRCAVHNNNNNKVDDQNVTGNCKKYSFEHVDACTVPVKRQKIICNHRSTEFATSTVHCEETCERMLKCGHKCRNKCSEACETHCEQLVSRLYPECNHEVIMKCFETDDRKICDSDCLKRIDCGHFCTSKCNELCTLPLECKVLVKCAILSPCGHSITKIRCGNLNEGDFLNDRNLLLQFCEQPCQTILKCGHYCTGSCIECHQGRSHKKCTQNCLKPLVCGHICSSLCSEWCGPCQDACLYKCQHTSCKKLCGEICGLCRVECPRSCVHQKCSKLCGEICNVGPCTQKCPKLLSCGHKCIGFCGDPCPPKCITCDGHELFQNDTGAKSEDSCYVLLNDCKHIIESSAMEGWLRQENQIGLKECPLCKVPIITTHRYSNFVKAAFFNAYKIKCKVLGESREKENKKMDLEWTLFALEAEYVILCSLCPTIKPLFTTLEQDLKYSVDNHMLKYELSTVENKIKTLSRLKKICTAKDLTIEDTKENFLKQLNFIVEVILSSSNYGCAQEMDDISCEFDRLQKIIELNEIKTSEYYTNNEMARKCICEIEACLLSVKRFSRADRKLKECIDHLTSLTNSQITFSNTNEPLDFTEVASFRSDQWLECRRGHVCTAENGKAVCKVCGL